MVNPISPTPFRPMANPNYNFEDSALLRKTARGYAEIAQETQILHPRLRRFLVFVDGKRTVSQLVETTQLLGDTRQALSELYQDGFIESVSADMRATVAAPQSNVASFPSQMAQPAAYVPTPQPVVLQQPAPQPVMRQTQSPIRPLEVVKELMLADLRARMGKDAELIAPKIKAAPSAEDLIVMMMRLRDILTKYSGPEQAEQFVNKFKDMLI
jgi:hypothetical protein